jgi:hypothetical protein
MLFFIIGVVAGYGLCLLFSPQEERFSRAQIRSAVLEESNRDFRR